MPIPPRKPLRPSVSPKPGTPQRKLSMTLPPSSTPPSPAEPPSPASPAAARKRRPLARRRTVVRSGSNSEDRIMERFIIRLGIGVVVLLLGGFGGRSLFSSSSPNQRYFNAFVDLQHQAERAPVSAEQVRRLPTASVTDPKLKDEILLQLVSLPDDLKLEDLKRMKALGERHDQLVSELNATYAH